MEPLKILVDVFYLNEARTGLRTYIESLCEQILKNQHGANDYVIVPTGLTPRKANSVKPGKISKLIYHLRYFVWKQIQLPAKAVKEKADVILCPDHVAPFWRMKALKVAVVHDAFFWQTPEDYNYYWGKYFRAMIISGLRGRSLVITTSKSAANHLSGILPERTKIEVVYQGSRFVSKANHSLSPSVFAKYGLKSRHYFLHVGVMEKRKNLVTLIRGFDLFSKQHPNTGMKLVLVGGRPAGAANDAFEEVVGEIKKRNLDQMACLTGYLEKEEVHVLLSNAGFYVFPSSNEGFGLPVLEAFSSHLPVIVSNQEALVEVGGNGVLSFDTFDASDLAGKMAMLYQNEALRISLVENGRKRLEEFTWEAFFETLEQKIESEFKRSRR